MSRKIAPDDLQWSLPTPTILWFCEAVLHHWVLNSIQLPYVKKHRCSRMHGTQHCCAFTLKSQEHAHVISLSYFVCKVFFFPCRIPMRKSSRPKKGYKGKRKILDSGQSCHNSLRALAWPGKAHPSSSNAWAVWRGCPHLSLLHTAPQSYLVSSLIL